MDLGSNSFRLEIGRYELGRIVKIEYFKETVRQGAGLDDDKNLTAESMQRGWDCLARFAERLAGFPRAHVRAVATQTLREARNRDLFIQRGSQILGYPIDVVSGPEEARLIYQGVARLLPQSDERRLVIDIGGRSTEVILGKQFTPSAVASFRVGSVAWSTRYFADGQFTARAFKTAEVAAKAVLDEALDIYQRNTWDVAYGSSGTVGAVGDILVAAGAPEGKITREGLDWIYEQLLRARSADRVRLEGLKEDRRAVIGGGISVLRAIFDLLEIDEMQVAQGALRQGALYDLLDREQPQTDLRSATVRGLMQRFAVDEQQAERVARIACMLFLETAPPQSERAARKLDWAARLHEIGTRISHSGYQRHGAYILDHTDAAGFALPELHHLSQLVLGHRGKVHKQGMDLDLADPLFALQLLSLRIAVLLCHARREPDIDGLRMQFDGQRCVLSSREGWSASYPQSAHLLQEEAFCWLKTPWEFAVELR